MPKKLEAQEAKPFQPIKTAFLRGVLEDAAEESVEGGGVATAIEPEMTTEPEAEAEAPPQPRRTERKVVELQRDVEARARRSRPMPVPAGGERLNRPLKVQLQASERTDLTRIVNELSSSLGTPLSVSHVTRALLIVFRHAEDEIQKRARQRGSLRRPPNDDLTAIAVFEHELAKLLLGALRDARGLRE
ncbi:MAG TPA: hypothetical protein VFF58_00780 [Candidatus Nitrosotalea sp.]|nr:hypothetical protein [Candidatus Nitrosotalea sp.]